MMAVAEALRLLKHRAPRNAPKTLMPIYRFATDRALSTVEKIPAKMPLTDLS
jgi:hypothetical protein